MVSPSKYPLQVFSMKSSSSTPMAIPSSSKIKTLIQTLIIDAFSKAKNIIVHVFEKKQQYIIYLTTRRNKKIATKSKIFFGSFRMHYNWCSSHSHVMPAPIMDYYDPTWNSVISTTKHDHQEYFGNDQSQLSDYLQWLEANNNKDSSCVVDDEINEIDRLADMFIENCHEKFRLEKVESYRRFQEMLARGV
ncbi:hypothetical protein ACFE04_001070 [Oxalis oulophora]